MKYLAFLLFVSLILFTACTNQNIPFESNLTPSATSSAAVSAKLPIQDEEIIASNLDTPWALAFLPDSSIIFTERAGTVRLINQNKQLNNSPIAKLSDVTEIGEGGLLGLAVDPDYNQNNYIYFYFTYTSNNNLIRNKVVRYKLIDQKLSEQVTILDDIPGSSNHNGGRLKFGPDKYLYITTGDAGNTNSSQDRNSLAGKILRVDREGKPASDNPFNNRVYSYGHRNVQGLAWNSNNQLWATEHGPSGLSSCCDEVNLIQKGQNYGWPLIQNYQQKQGMQTPIKSSESSTWAPAGAIFIDDNLIFAGLRGQSIYKAKIQNQTVYSFSVYLTQKYGRIRDVISSPDQMIYICTSNRDGRGTPANSDDKIVRINPKLLSIETSR